MSKLHRINFKTRNFRVLREKHAWLRTTVEMRHLRRGNKVQKADFKLFNLRTIPAEVPSSGMELFSSLRLFSLVVEKLIYFFIPIFSYIL